MFALYSPKSRLPLNEARTGDACDRARQTASNWAGTEGYTWYS